MTKPTEYEDDINLEDIIQGKYSYRCEVGKLIDISRQDHAKKQEAWKAVKELEKTKINKIGLGLNYGKLIDFIFETKTVEKRGEVIEICRIARHNALNDTLTEKSDKIIQLYMDIDECEQKESLTDIIEIISEVNPDIIIQNRQIIKDMFELSITSQNNAINVLYNLIKQDYTDFVSSFENLLFNVLEQPDKLAFSSPIVLIQLATRKPNETSINRLIKNLNKMILGVNGYTKYYRLQGMNYSVLFITNLPEFSNEVILSLYQCLNSENENEHRNSAKTFYKIWDKNSANIFDQFSDINRDQIANRMESADVNREITDNYDESIELIQNKSDK